MFQWNLLYSLSWHDKNLRVSPASPPLRLCIVTMTVTILLWTGAGGSEKYSLTTEFPFSLKNWPRCGTGSGRAERGAPARARAMTLVEHQWTRRHWQLTSAGVTGAKGREETTRKYTQRLTDRDEYFANKIIVDKKKLVPFWAANRLNIFKIFKWWHIN